MKRSKTPTKLHTDDGYITEKHFKIAEKAFDYIEVLPNDWDSYGAKAPTEASVRLAKDICSMFPREIQPEIQPEKDGSIGLYWESSETYCIFIKAPDMSAWRILDMSDNVLSEQKKVSKQDITSIAHSWLKLFPRLTFVKSK